MRLAVKSLARDFPQALGTVLPLSFVHLPIVLSNPVLASQCQGDNEVSKGHMLNLDLQYSCAGDK